VAIIERLLRDLKASFAQISGVIELEPSLALKLISVANSPLFAGLMPVRTVGEALNRVGLNEAREILITFMYQNLFQAAAKAYHRILSRWWEHALLTALACQGLAGRVRLSQPNYAYLLGLLHDIGKPCLLKAFAAEWGERSLTAGRSEELLALIDRHHRQVAENVLSGSGFPAIFLRAVRSHGLPHKDALAPEVLLLNAANDIVQAIQAGKELKAETFQEMVSIALLGLSPQDLETVIEATVKRYESIIQVFGG
jgi:HD-like signal output (HDOD) protein